MRKIFFFFAVAVICTVVSCREILGTELQNVLFKIVNNSANSIEYSFFTHKKADKDNNVICIRIGQSTILPNNSIGGGEGFYDGEYNSWVDYFNTEKIDTFYVIISATPIEAKEGQKYNALPGGSNVLKIYKYTKENFYDYNPETDVAAFVYP